MRRKGLLFFAIAALSASALPLSPASAHQQSQDCFSASDCEMGGIEKRQCLPVHATGNPAAASSADASSPFDAGFACSCVAGRCRWVDNKAEHEAIRQAVKAYAKDNLPSFNPETVDYIQIRTLQEPSASASMTYNGGYNYQFVCDFQLRENTGNWVVDPAASRCAPTPVIYPSYSIERFNGKMTALANYGVTGYVVGKSECQPCPEKTPCEACLQDHIVISEHPIREPLTESRITEHELVVFTDKPSAFTIGEKYDFSIRLTRPVNFTGKYMDSYASRVLLLGFQPGSPPVNEQAIGSAREPRITISEADQACQTDADCTDAQTTCSGCSCNEPVNVQHKTDYVRKLHERCDSLSLPQCDYFCRTPYSRCINHRCAMRSSPAPR